MAFSDVRDQSAPLRLLRNMLLRKRIPNGLLFWGPGGVGKGLTALELAKAMNCTGAEGDACGACLGCRRVANGNHPDVKSIAPAGRGRIINVDTVDFMSDLAAYRPFEGQWRVFLVHDADRMNIPAQNHFLKTLEEPPSNTLFVLLTEFPRILLPTIRSRCQSVRFGALRPETVKDLLLRGHDLADETAEAVAAVSQGQMSRALDMLESERREVVLHVTEGLAMGGDPLVLGEEFSQHLNLKRDAIKASVKTDFEAEAKPEMSKEDREEQKEAQVAIAESLIRRELMEYLYLFQTWYRDVLVFAVTGDVSRALNRDQGAQLGATTAEGVARKLEAVETAWRYIERNLNVDRVFRDLFFVLAP